MIMTNENDEIPDGFVLEHDQVKPEVWTNIQRWISSDMLPSSAIEREGAPSSSTHENDNNVIHAPIPWETSSHSQGRKVAQFGNCKYDYVADVAERCNASINPIPDYICQALLSGEPNGHQYTQCIINSYEANNVIPWHIDHEYFGPEVLVYTFGEDRPLLLRKPIIHTEGNQDEHDDDNYIYSRVNPRHCSKYLLSGLARDVWEHSVPSGKGERVSITFRSWVGPKESESP